jgi:AAA family ATP:ADP antiporter
MSPETPASPAPNPSPPSDAAPLAPTALGRLLGRVANVQPGEVAAVVAAFFLIFFVLGGYFAVRPVRETFGTILGRSRTEDLWVVTFIGALVIVPVYGALVARIRRGILLPLIYGVVALSLVGFAIAINADEKNVTVAASFYVWISVLNLMLVSVFWSFALELFDSGQAKRLFGFIAAGGTAGALFGPIVTGQTVRYIGNTGVLIFSAAMFAAAIVAQRILLQIWERSEMARSVQAARAAPRDGAAPPPRADRALGGNPFAGFSILFRSPYLLMIALFVMLLSVATSLLYFEQLNLVAARYSSTAERTQVFAWIDNIVQALAILSQLFLTGRVAQRLGVVALLTIVPAVVALGFGAIALDGALWVVVSAMILRRWGEYAFIRPGREMLFSRLDTETKYKAKNLIDVPVYRGADALSAQMSKLLEKLGFTTVGFATLGAIFAVIWLGVGWWLGRRSDRGDRGAEAAASARPGQTANSPASNSPA